MIVGMNADLEAQGYIVRADSIEELAEKLNIPVDTFKATVERYNELAAKGVDEDFGKESYRLSTLDTAPYFGTRQCGGYFICTMDGIQIDRKPDRGPLCRRRLLRKLLRRKLPQPDGRCGSRTQHNLRKDRGQKRGQRDLR